MDAKDFAINLQKMLSSLAAEATSKANLQDMGDQAVDIIKKRTLLGYGVDKQGGNKSKLKPLASSTKLARSRKQLASNTTANKSNLTETGTMLEGMSAKVSTGNVEIGFTDSKLDEQAGYVSEDRPFNNLSLAEIEQLRKKLEARLDVLVKALNAKP